MNCFNFMGNKLNEPRPLVSVIINCYNGGKYLPYAIESALNQTYENFEIIVWDNVSSEDIKSIILRYDDNRIRYFRSATHSSLGEARNRAIAVSAGEYLAFLDSDDLWRKEKLSRQIELFNKNERIVLVYSDAESFNESGLRKRHGNHKKYVRGSVFGELLSDYFLIMSSVIINKKFYLEKKIKFNPDFQMVEEADVFLRISLFGIVDYVDEVLCDWRVHGESTTWKKYYLIAKESEDMVKNLSRDFKFIEEYYHDELINHNIWILRQKIIACWLDGNSNRARKLIRDNFFNLPMKINLFYFITWLDPKLFAKPLFYIFSSTVSPK